MGRRYVRHRLYMVRPVQAGSVKPRRPVSTPGRTPISKNLPASRKDKEYGIGVAAAVRREQAAIALHPFQEVFDVDGAYDGQGAMIKSLFEHFQAVFVAFLCRGSDIILVNLEPCTAG